MSIRIAGGRFKGRKLETAPGKATRPLLAQVRESIFDILGPVVQGAEVWDLFAGTGATGLEASSRGARRVVFVERARHALQVLRKNLALLEDDLEEDGILLVRGDAWKPGLVPSRETLRGEPGRRPVETPPDLVFLDPPFEQIRARPRGALEDIRALLARTSPGGQLVFHLPESTFTESELSRLGVLDLRRWGTSMVAFLEGEGRKDEEPEVLTGGS